MFHILFSVLIVLAALVSAIPSGLASKADGAGSSDSAKAKTPERDSTATDATETSSTENPEVEKIISLLTSIETDVEFLKANSQAGKKGNGRKSKSKTTTDTT